MAGRQKRPATADWVGKTHKLLFKAHNNAMHSITLRDESSALATSLEHHAQKRFEHATNSLKNKVLETQALRDNLQTHLTHLRTHTILLHKTTEAMQTFLDSRQAPIRICEMRIALREQRPQQECVQDSVEHCLSREKEDLLQSMHILSADIKESKKHLRNMAACQTVLADDLADKIAGLKVDQDCLRKRQPPQALEIDGGTTLDGFPALPATSQFQLTKRSNSNTNTLTNTSPPPVILNLHSSPSSRRSRSSSNRSPSPSQTESQSQLQLRHYRKNQLPPTHQHRFQNSTVTSVGKRVDSPVPQGPNTSSPTTTTKQNATTKSGTEGAGTAYRDTSSIWKSNTKQAVKDAAAVTLTAQKLVQQFTKSMAKLDASNTKKSEETENALVCKVAQTNKIIADISAQVKKLTKESACLKNQRAALLSALDEKKRPLQRTQQLVQMREKRPDREYIRDQVEEDLENELNHLTAHVQELQHRIRVSNEQISTLDESLKQLQHDLQLKTAATEVDKSCLELVSSQKAINKQVKDARQRVRQRQFWAPSSTV